MQIRKYFSSILSIPLQEINNIIDKKSNRYHKYSVLKKNNVGKRTIYHPSREIKSLQYILVSNIFSKLKTSQYAMAYIKGKKNPLRENAQKHSNFRYNLRIDFENFFASIIFDDLKYYLKKHEEIL